MRRFENCCGCGFGYRITRRVYQQYKDVCEDYYKDTGFFRITEKATILVAIRVAVSFGFRLEGLSSGLRVQVCGFREDLVLGSGFRKDG